MAHARVVRIHRLRSAIEPEPSNLMLIQTALEIGYVHRRPA